MLANLAPGDAEEAKLMIPSIVVCLTLAAEDVSVVAVHVLIHRARCLKRIWSRLWRKSQHTDDCINHIMVHLAQFGLISDVFTLYSSQMHPFMLQKNSKLYDTDVMISCSLSIIALVILTWILVMLSQHDMYSNSTQTLSSQQPHSAYS